MATSDSFKNLDAFEKGAYRSPFLSPELLNCALEGSFCEPREVRRKYRKRLNPYYARGQKMLWLAEKASETCKDRLAKGDLSNENKFMLAVVTELCESRFHLISDLDRCLHESLEAGFTAGQILSDLDTYQTEFMQEIGSRFSRERQRIVELCEETSSKIATTRFVGTLVGRFYHSYKNYVEHQGAFLGFLKSLSALSRKLGTFYQADSEKTVDRIVNRFSRYRTPLDFGFTVSDILLSEQGDAQEEASQKESPSGPGFQGSQVHEGSRDEQEEVQEEQEEEREKKEEDCRLSDESVTDQVLFLPFIYFPALL